MPVKISQLPYEPIVLCEYLGLVREDDVQRAQWQTEMAVSAINGHIYRVSDTRHTDFSPTALLSMLAHNRHVTELLVVQPEALAEFSHHVETFTSLHEALSFVRREALRAAGD